VQKSPIMHTEDEIIELGPFDKVTDNSSKRVQRNRFFYQKFNLVILDFIMVQLAFVLSGWIFGTHFYLTGDFTQFVLNFTLSLVILAFFPRLGLYSYHIVFLRKKHLTSLIKSFTLSFLSLGIVFSICLSTRQFNDNYLITLIFMIAIGMMLLSRFLWDQLIDIIDSIGVSLLIIGFIGIVSPDSNGIEIINFQMISISYLFAVVFLVANRYFLIHIVFKIWLRHRFRRQVAIVGSDEEAKSIINHIIHFNAPYWVVGIVTEADLNVSISKKNLGTLEKLPDIVAQYNIDEIIVTDEKIKKRVLISLLDYSTTEKITVWFPPKLMPIIDMKLYIDNFCGLKMIRLCSQKNSWLYNRIKHSFDAIVTLPVFLILLPIFSIIALSIKLSCPGPVFYRAKAVGKDGKIFTMYKFRSMRENIDPNIHKSFVTKLIKGEISNREKKDQPLKIADDPRVTSVGKFLRKFSLDELPQLINVLKGDMSLVGPRPCLPYEYEIYLEWHKKRTSIRPGITGIWQVAGRSSVLFEDMIIMDLYYIYNRSITLDLSILYETIFAVLERRGAY